MDIRLSSHSMQKPVMGLTLCLLLLLSLSGVSAAAEAVVLEDNDPLSSLVLRDGTVDLIGLLRSVLETDRLREAAAKDPKPLQEGRDLLQQKRGFGIAGLDNVDMITSTLDRSRSRSRSRSRYQPSMSLSVDLNQLRALMAKAG